MAIADAEPPLVLAIDIGSSSARVVLYDGRGRAVDGVVAQEQYAIHTTADGAAEDDPDAALARVARCVDAALRLAGPLASRIGAVAVDTLATTTMAIDAAGRPLTPLITYADTRNAADADALRQSLDERAVHDRTGCMLRTSYWPARLAWLRRTRPEVWRSAARWISVGEYLELRLFGQCRASYSVASWGGLLDRRRLAWDAPLLDQLGLAPDHLAPLVDVDEPLQGLVELYAARWPALRAVPWFPAVGDGAAANVGSGCSSPSRMALTIGTTGAMRVVIPAAGRGKERRSAGDQEIDSGEGSLSPRPLVSPERVPAGLWCYRVDRQHALLGGATSEGGNVYAWLRQTLRLGDAAEVEAALAACPPDGHGLTVLPFVAGERSPDWAGNVQATLHGLTLATTPIAILRASLEAVAYRFALIFERLGASDLGLVAGASSPRPQSSHIVASGSGLLHSPAWMQIFADVLGRPVVTSAVPEATSRGAAVLALRALGALPSLEAAQVADGPAYAPDDARHAIYHDAIARQRWLYGRLIATS
ncbi:MAG: gluconokinase [Kouleothrix sp.]|nr:gluconokinase [Kouleothrix sp.]